MDHGMYRSIRPASIDTTCRYVNSIATPGILDTVRLPMLPFRVLTQKYSVYMLREVDSGPEFAQDHRSGVGFEGRSLVLYKLS